MSNKEQAKDLAQYIFQFWAEHFGVLGLCVLFGCLMAALLIGFWEYAEWLHERNSKRD